MRAYIYKTYSDGDTTYVEYQFLAHAYSALAKEVDFAIENPNAFIERGIQFSLYVKADDEYRLNYLGEQVASLYIINDGKDIEYIEG